MKLKKKVPRQKNKTLDLNTRATNENKLTYAALILNYAFDYGIDLKNRTIKITGPIDQFSFDLVDTAMTYFEAESKASVIIRINCPGGDTYEAMAIIARLRMSKCHIITECLGHCMSAATLILSCGDKRRMSKLASWMWHESSYGLEGKHSEIKATAKQVEREELLWANTMAEFSNKNSKYWLKTGIGIDAYFSADELLKTGAIDEVF